MTTPRLSEIDLARLCARDDSSLEVALRGYKGGGGSWSYAPTRAATGDLLAARTPLIGEMTRVPWARLKRTIEMACTRGDDQKLANVEVSKALYDESLAKVWDAVSLDFGAMPIGMGEAVRFWANAVVDTGDGPVVFFPDHRRANGLESPKARAFVYSMQAVWVKARFPDLQDARLAVMRFPIIGGKREVILHIATSEELLSYEQLDERVRHVYDVWGRVFKERVEERRRTGTGG